MHHHGQRHRAGSQLVHVLATFLSSHIYAQAPNVQGFELFKACTSMVNAIVLGLNWCVSWRLSFLLTFKHKILMYKAFELFNACTSMVNAIVLGLNCCVSWQLSRRGAWRPKVGNF